MTSTAVAEEQRAGASEDREGAAAAAAAAADAARAKRMVSRGKGSRKVEEVANAEDYEHSPTEVVRVLVWQQPDESAGAHTHAHTRTRIPSSALVVLSTSVGVCRNTSAVCLTCVALMSLGERVCERKGGWTELRVCVS